MAVTQNTYTGNGSTVLYSFTFPYLETTDIKVSVNGTNTTAYTLANATTVQFNTAPANGAAIRIYRETDDSSLQATFYPGSAIRSSDLNDNFTQNLYVTQEANNVSAAATTTANTALTNSNTAISTANASAATSAQALANSQTAVTQSASAVSTANSASSSASSAVSTANSAASNAATALSNSQTALTQSANAVTTANQSSTTAGTALTNSQTALSQSASAVSTAGTASTNATNALSNSQTALTQSASATSTANTALSTANAAASAVANAILYDTVANVAAIPASPANNDAVEVVNSTGIQTFTPLSGLPPGFVGDAGLSVRLVYTTTGSTWNWIQYFPNDPEARYGDAITTLQTDLTAAEGDITTLQGDVLGLDNDKVAKSGDTMTGSLTTTALIPSGSTVPTNGVYLPAANTVGISTNGVGRLSVSSTGDLTLGTSTAGGTFYVLSNSGGYNGPAIVGQPGGTSAWHVGTSANFAGDGSTDLALQAGTSRNIRFYTGGATERMRLDSQGRLGVGTTPDSRLHVQGLGSASGYTSANNAGIKVDFGTGNNGVVNLVGGAELGVYRSNSSGAYDVGVGFGDNSNRILRFDTAGSERARIDSSGRLLVGTSSFSDGATLVLQGNSTNSNWDAVLRLLRNISNPAAGETLGSIIYGVGSAQGAQIQGVTDAQWGTNDYPTRLVFSVTRDGSASPTEAVRISNSGVFSHFAAGGGSTVNFARSGAGADFNNAFYEGRHTATGTTDGTRSFIVYTNGNVQNTNNSYGALSDIKLKENIVDATSQWSDIKALKVRKYNFKESQTHTQIGLVAQEVELVSPGLVSESPDRDAEGNDLGTVTKSVNYSVLYMKAVKALQEAMERIETLEAKVAALESA